MTANTNPTPNKSTTNVVKMVRPSQQQVNSRNKKPAIDLTEFKVWLASLGLGDATPTIHINGPAFHHAVMTVDFGTPLEQIKITTEQTGELGERIKLLTKLILDKDINIRISFDSMNGVWWSSAN